MRFLVTALLLVAGIIHLLPLPGALGASRLEKLYGLPFGEPNLLILMQHRAILFGLLGLFLVYAAFQSEWQRMAILAGLVSAGSFVAIAYSVGGYGTAVQRVVIADIVAIVCLLVAGGAVLLAEKHT